MSAFKYEQMEAYIRGVIASGNTRLVGVIGAGLKWAGDIDKTAVLGAIALEDEKVENEEIQAVLEAMLEDDEQELEQAVVDYWHHHIKDKCLLVDFGVDYVMIERETRKVWGAAHSYLCDEYFPSGPCRGRLRAGVALEDAKTADLEPLA